MAYTSSDLQLTPQSITGRKKWIYLTAADGSSLIGASSYITDAYSKGMVAGDEVTSYNSSAGTVYYYGVTTVRTSSSADLTSGLKISST